MTSLDEPGECAAQVVPNGTTSPRSSRGAAAERTLVVCCPDWPVVAAGIPAGEPAVVLHANRVVSVSPAAREVGVVEGLRRREAQGRCPEVALVDHDPARDARAFEPVVLALEALTPRLEVTRPGVCAFATRGPARYFGGDAALAERAGWIATGVVAPGGTARVGVADGAFAALLAARQAAFDRPAVIPRWETPAFLAPHAVDTLTMLLDCGDLVDVWRRLGLRRLGQVAALDVADVLARFATDGVIAHRMACGLDPHLLDARRPAPDLLVSAELDPPAEQVDRATFLAKSLADALHEKLAGRGLACTRIVVQVETEHGETFVRSWRHEGTLSAGAIADRVRWQLDGWLSGATSVRPTAGITRLSLVPDEVVAARGRQLGFWGGESLVDERVVRAIARVQGLLGVDAVTVPECRGGRGPGEQVARVPAAAVDLTASRPPARLDAVAEPWPGRVPTPAPATVHVEPLPVEVVDADDRPVGVTGRGTATGEPARIAIAGRGWAPVMAWAGPWPADERWWDPHRHRRRARFQVTLVDGAAHLLAVEAGRWWLEATY
jgi:protein ImuB